MRRSRKRASKINE